MSSSQTFDKESSHSLYVIEAIELDLGLTLNHNDPSYTCPIYLTVVSVIIHNLIKVSKIFNSYNDLINSG